MTGELIMQLLRTNGFDRLFDAMEDAVFACDLSGRPAYANEAQRVRLGDLADKAPVFGTLVTPEQRDHALAQFAFATQGETASFVIDARRPDGRPTRVQVTLAPLVNEGTIVGVIGTARDVEELESSREQQTALQTQLETVLNNISDGFYLFSPEWRFTYVNPRGEAIAQRPASELIGRLLWDEFPSTISDEFGRAYRRAVAENRTVVVRDLYEPLGTWLEAAAYPTPDGLAVYVRDVTAEEATRLQLIESENRLAAQAALLDVAHDAIIVRDLDHRVRYWNAAAHRIYGWSAEEAMGRSVHELLDPDHEIFAPAAAHLLREGHWRGELSQHTKTGTVVRADSSWTLVCGADGAPDAVLVVSTDITERKRQEAAIMRSQRLTTLGTFAGGIAHDLNNVLTPILTSAQLLAEDESDAQRAQMLSAIEASALRGAEMIRQVLTFASGLEGQRTRIDVADILTEFRTWCVSTLPKTISIAIAAVGPARNTVGDRTQLLQVLMNLAVNARDAMPEGGVLTVSTGIVEVDAAEAETHGVTPGPFAAIAVEDSGVGMTPEILSRMYEPFFTTKPPGSGTGLGLATSQAIMRGHGGLIRATSEPGAGSRFEMLLPAADADTAVAALLESHTDPPMPRGSGEEVLVVDDEQEIRLSTRHALESHGYSVALAAHGQEALDYLANDRTRVALVLTDIMMPGMDGTTLAAAIAGGTTRVPVIAMSGLTANDPRGESPGIAEFLPKPFSMSELLTAVRRVLDSEVRDDAG